MPKFIALPDARTGQTTFVNLDCISSFHDGEFQPEVGTLPDGSEKYGDPVPALIVKGSFARDPAWVIGEDIEKVRGAILG